MQTDDDRLREALKQAAPTVPVEGLRERLVQAPALSSPPPSNRVGRPRGPRCDGLDRRIPRAAPRLPKRK
jgi:hypothetical protein